MIISSGILNLKDKRIHIVAAPGICKTIFGLELVRRRNAPALVMSPSVTIRQQWGERFVEAYLPETENPTRKIKQALIFQNVQNQVAMKAPILLQTKELQIHSIWKAIRSPKTLRNFGCGEFCLE